MPTLVAAPCRRFVLVFSCVGRRVSGHGLVLACSVWLKLGAGARKFQGGNVTPLTSDFFKVYQNKGNREVRDAASTDRGCAPEVGRTEGDPSWGPCLHGSSALCCPILGPCGRPTNGRRSL